MWGKNKNVRFQKRTVWRTFFPEFVFENNFFPPLKYKLFFFEKVEKEKIWKISEKFKSEKKCTLKLLVNKC